MTLRSGIALLVAVSCIAACAQMLSLDAYNDGPCSPGTRVACPYSGPKGTLGVGVCRAGSRTCRADGSGYSACSGEVTPKPEDCSTPEDENCDGQVNEASAGCCQPGSRRACYTGPKGTLGVGICAAGRQLCNHDGRGYGACTDQTLPGIETCQDARDENCDGRDCVQWAELLGDAADQNAYAVAVDASGNAIVVGSFHGEIKAGGVDLVDQGSGDAFVLKLDPNGTPLWGVSFGDLGAELANAVAIDSLGDVIFAGTTDDAITLGGALVQPGIFVAKLGGADGHFVWSHGFGGGPCPDATGAGVAITSANDVVVAGAWCGSLDFGDGPMGAPPETHFVATLRGGDGSGKPSAGSWARTFGNGDSQEVTAVVVRRYGALEDIVIGGDFNGQVQLDANHSVTSSGGNDLFYARLRLDGTPLAVRRFGNGHNQRLTSLAADGEGNLYLSGDFEGAVDFGGGSLGAAPPGHQKAFLAAFNASDGYRWAKPFGTDTLGALSMATTKAGDLVLGGAFSAPIDFGAGGVSPLGVELDLFVARLTKSGDPVWNRGFVTHSPIAIGHLALNSAGESILAGYVSGPPDFGGGQLAPAGGSDVFVAKLGK